MFVECTYTRPIRSESRPAQIEKELPSARDIWRQMNVAKITISLVSRMENYQCSQAVIGQLCIVSYRWLDNSRMSTIIAKVHIFTPEKAPVLILQ